MGLSSVSRIVALIELNSPDFKIFFRNKLKVFENESPQLKKVFRNLPPSFRLLLKEDFLYDGLIWNEKGEQTFFMAKFKHLVGYTYKFAIEPFPDCPEKYEFTLELKGYPEKAIICVHTFDD
jgi:hypothetical protein